MGNNKTAALVLGVLCCAAAPAAAQGCPPDTAVPGWVSITTSNQGPGSTSAPEPDVVAICSATDGFGDTADHYRVAFQPRDHDFTLTAMVSSVDVEGSGGLVALAAQGTLHAARVAVEVYVAPSGNAYLRSSIRREAGGMVDAPIAAVPVTLPVTLQLVREGDVIRTGIVGGATHLSAVVDTQGDLMGPVRVGVMQTSNDAQALRSATFDRIALSAPEPGAEIACVEPQALYAGAPLAIRGVHLDRIESVRIGGVLASFDAASSSRLVATVPDAFASWQRGDVEVAQDGRYRRVGAASFVGTRIRRGDVDEDGAVTTEDYRALCHHVYRRAVLECSAAGDVDGDGDRDADDVSRLERFLRTGAEAPVAPFDEPGFVAGSFACGQPAGPEIHAIQFADGSPVDRPVREGDDLVIVGVGLPVPDRAVVRFGPTEAVPAASSTPERLAVRVRTVIEGGAQCPRIFDADPAAPGETRFGPAFGVAPGSDLCVDFEASRVDRHLAGRMVDGQLEIDVPPEVLQPGARLTVSFALHLPYVVGGTRGPRAATFDFVVPNAPYAEALGALGRRLSRAIHGASTEQCDCEVAVTDAIPSEMLILPPCHLLPTPPPEPVIPGLPDQVLPTRIIWSELDILQQIPGPGCAGTIDRATQPRRFFWCELEKVAEVQGLDAHPAHWGLPLWESYQGVLDTLPVHPEERSTHQKSILTSPGVHDVLETHYQSPCAMALRATQCKGSPTQWWMPPFPEGEHVLKTFWQPFQGLPASVDASTLYSYDPPNEPRMYLVGMHIGYSIGIADGNLEMFDTPPDYFEWSTFWLEADDDTLTKGGQPLSSVYSPHCTTGSAADRPSSLDGGPFAGFAMCTDSRPGEEACGNPWAPGECPANGTTSCTGCHTQMGTTHFAGNQSNLATEAVGFGWFATIVAQRAANATACLPLIEDDITQFAAGWNPDGYPNAPNCFLGF